MHELKFRVWSKNFQKFITHDVFGVDAPILVISLDGKVMSHSEGYGYSWQSDCVIQQYTGLVDKNGKEIYEGDIIHSVIEVCSERGEFNDYVDDKKFEVKYQGNKFNVLTNTDSWKIRTYEVIGNIFENPELL